MQLGNILIGRGLVTAADIDAALARQLTEGGRLGDNLIAMELLTAEQLATVINTAPAVPASLEETGISARNLLNLLLKFMLVEGCETLLDLAERLKLPRRAVQQLLDEAVHQKLIQAVGAAPGGLATARRRLRPVSRRFSRMSSISPMPSKPAVRSSGSSIRLCTSPPRPPRPPRRPPGLGSRAKRSISAGSPASGRSW